MESGINLRDGSASDSSRLCNRNADVCLSSEYGDVDFNKESGARSVELPGLSNQTRVALGLRTIFGGKVRKGPCGGAASESALIKKGAASGTFFILRPA